MLIPEASLTLFLPGWLLPDESLHEPDDPDQPLQYGLNTGQNTVVVELNIDGEVQSLSLTLDQWHLLVEHGIHRSPALLQFFVRHLSSGWQTLESLQEELRELLGRQDLDPKHQAGRNEISLLLDEIESIPPKTLSLTTMLQSLYEQTLKSEAGWIPVSEDAPAHAAGHSLNDLREALSRLETLNRTYSALRAISEKHTPPLRYYDHLTLEQFLAQMEQDIRKLQKQLLQRSLDNVHAGLQQQGRGQTGSVPGVISLPVPGSSTEEKGQQLPGVQQEQAPNKASAGHAPSTGQDEASSTAAGDQPPPTGAGNAPVPKRRHSLKEIANEKLYERSIDEQIVVLRESADQTGHALDPDELLTIILGHLEPDLQSDLRVFFRNVSLYGSSEENWAELEQLGFMSKGLVLAILWAQGIPESHPAIKAIMGSTLIYQELERGGFMGIWKLLDNNTDFHTYLFDVVEYTALSRTRSDLRQRLQLDHPLFPLHVHHVHQTLLVPENCRRVLELHLPGVGQSLVQIVAVLGHEHSGDIAPSARQPPSPEPELEDDEDLLNDPDWMKYASDEQLKSQLQTALRGSPLFRDLVVIRKLGTGAYGIVFEVSRGAEHFALKYVLIKDEKHQKSLERSVWAMDILLSLRSDFHNVILQHELDLEKSRYIQLMEIVDKTLDEAMGSQGMTPAVFYERWFKPVLKQIMTLHALGFYHRDLKPSNIGSRGRQVVIIDLDSLYYSGPRSSESGFGTLMGSPEFGHPGLFQRIIQDEQVLTVDPVKQDYAGLAHIWLFGRLGQAVFSVYRDNLKTFDDHLYRVYFRGQLSQVDRARLGLSLVDKLRENPAVFSQLFSLANAQQTPMDNDIARELWLKKSVGMGDLEALALKLEQSWPARPEQNRPDRATQSLPTPASAIELHDTNSLPEPSSAHSLRPATAGTESYSAPHPTRHTALVRYGQKQLGRVETRKIVRTWREYPTAALYLYDNAYILTQEPLPEGKAITFSEFIVHTQQHWTETEQQRAELELGYSTPLRVSDGSGRSVPNPHAREILRHMPHGQRLSQLFSQFVRLMKLHRDRQSHWESFTPEISLELEHNGQSFYQGIHLRFNIRRGSAGTTSLERQRQDLRQLTFLAAELLTTIQSSEQADPVPPELWPLTEEVIRTLNGPAPEQLNRQVSAIMPMGLSAYGRYLFQQEVLVQQWLQWLQWQQMLTLLQHFSAASVAYRTHHEVVSAVSHYKQQLQLQLQSLKSKLDELGQNAVSTDSLLTADIQDNRISHEMNQVPNLDNLAELLRKSGVYQQVLALLSGQSDLYVEQHAIKGQLQQLEKRGRLKKGYVLLALETFGAGQYYYLLANSDHYVKDAALAKPMTDLIEMLEPPEDFRPDLQLALVSHELLQQGITNDEILKWLGSVKYQPRVHLTPQTHPLILLSRWKLDSVNSYQGNLTPEQFSYQLTRLHLDMKHLARPRARSTHSAQTFSTPCPHCRTPMQRVTALHLAQIYHNDELKLSGANCDACRKTITHSSYGDSRCYASQADILHCHCTKNGMDLCDECVSKPARCPASGCGRIMKPVTAEHTGYREGTAIFCDQCGQAFSGIVKQQLQGINTVWHCDSTPSHDLCQSCLLRQRGYPTTANCPHHGKTLPSWSPGWHQCMTCGGELQPEEIVAECPDHFKNAKGQYFSGYAHPECLSSSHRPN